jgi:hypothetical protein
MVEAGRNVFFELADLKPGERILDVLYSRAGAFLVVRGFKTGRF